MPQNTLGIIICPAFDLQSRLIYRDTIVIIYNDPVFLFILSKIYRVIFAFPKCIFYMKHVSCCFYYLFSTRDIWVNSVNAWQGQDNSYM